MSPTTSRMTAAERRDAIVAAATEEFATGGLVGASTEAIARRVGVSQPYVFQLFGTKKELFLAVVDSCFSRIIQMFDAAGTRWTPESIECDTRLGAMGLAYTRLLADRTLLLMQLQAYAACSDPDVRAAVRAGWAQLYRRVVDVSGASRDEVHAFFAEGMLLNLGAAVGLPGAATGWSLEMFEGDPLPKPA
jgi:AcrR family transcriptional regulator